MAETLKKFADENRLINGGFAIDLGCGNGHDTHELLHHGWSVLAIDKQPEALTATIDNALPEARARLTVQQAAFEEVKLPPCDLICASMSLPFCHPQDFDRLWAEIEGALRSGGRFCGQLFGNRDSWASDSKEDSKTFHSEAQAKARFAHLDIEEFIEREHDGKTAVGQQKHWHIFGVIAKKKYRYSGKDLP